MSCQPKAQSIGVSLALIFFVPTAYSEEARYEVGFRGNVLLGDGVPANDILGLGVIGRWRGHDGDRRLSR